MNAHQTMEKSRLKEIAITFLQLVAKGHVQEAYSSYVDPQFYHHNPYFKGDRESLLKGMEQAATMNPNKQLDVKQAIEENNKVVILSHMKQHPDDRGVVLVHIFRFNGDKIIELWDIGQPIPENLINEHGIF